MVEMRGSASDGAQSDPELWFGHNAALCTSCPQLQPLAPEGSLSCSHLSHSVSSHLDSSPESSEAGAEVLLSRTGKNDDSLGQQEGKGNRKCSHVSIFFDGFVRLFM